jgi:hypothetical protein
MAGMQRQALAGMESNASALASRRAGPSRADPAEQRPVQMPSYIAGPDPIGYFSSISTNANSKLFTLITSCSTPALRK